MTGKVISLADRANDNTFITVDQMLELAIHERRDGRLNGSKAILLVLDQGEDGTAYATRFRCANMKKSEIVALLETRAHCFKRELLGG